MVEISGPVTSTDGGVQSLERAFLLLELMAEVGGEVALSRLAVERGIPLSTIHRLVCTLVARGNGRQAAFPPSPPGSRPNPAGENCRGRPGNLAALDTRS